MHLKFCNILKLESKTGKKDMEDWMWCGPLLNSLFLSATDGAETGSHNVSTTCIEKALWSLLYNSSTIKGFAYVFQIFIVCSSRQVVQIFIFHCPESRQSIVQMDAFSI